MKTDTPGVDWLLDCEPRPAQLEALARSYTGVAYRDRRDDPSAPERLSHYPNPARGWGHFMEMRVGKTPTLLNEFMLFRRDYGLTNAVVFAPNKYKYTWAIEAERFGVDVPVHVFESTYRNRFTAFIRENPEYMVFVNYEALIQDVNVKMLEEVVTNRTYVGADESVMIKNHKSNFFMGANLISKDAAVTRPMTGKPTPQGVQDLYSQLRFARAIDGMNFYAFRNRFAVMGGFQGRQVKGVKNEEKLDLIKRQSIFFARRRDWGTQIDSDYETTELTMTDRQKAAYIEMEKEFVLWLDTGEVVTADQVITKHMKLQQISSGFIYDEDRNVHWVEPFDKTPKFKDLIDRLRNYETNKVIIIYHYKPTGAALADALSEFNPALIMGNTDMKARGVGVDAEKARFNEDPECRVLLGQSKAIKYGHTLMGTPEDPCLTIVYYENSYSLDDRAQSEERPQGEGQPAAINILDYVSSPIEKKVIGALQMKEEIASKIMGYYKEK